MYLFNLMVSLKETTRRIGFLSVVFMSFVFLGKAQTVPPGFETVFYEGFDYPTGEDLYYQSGGNGFTSNWAGYYQTKYLSVQSNGWTYPNLQTTGLRAGYDNTCYVPICNQISSSGREIPSQSSGVLYLQFLANFGTQSGGGTPELRLYDDSGSKVIIGASSASNWRLSDIDSDITASTVSSVSVLRLVVVRFDYDNGNIKIWIDPNLATFDYSNVPTPSSEINSITTPSFNRLELYFRSNGTPGIDEILAFKLSPPPIITGPNSETGATSAVSMNENATAVHTFSADETVTWSLGSTNDEALFGMDSSGNLVFTNAPDYETPSSTLNSNTYVVEVIATDAANNSTKQTLTITVVDIPSTTFGAFAAINKQYFVGTFTIVPPTTNNTNPIVYTSDNTAVATLSGSVITFTDVGTTNITATQAADDNYEGNTVSTLLTVLGKDLVSNYGSISSTDVTYVDANGKVGGAFGVDKYGDIQYIYEDLVTSGLIMHLDAGNSSSYSGAGTAWNDISGYGNHGTLINGVTYNSANGGNLVFNGSNTYVNAPLTKTASSTFSVWAKSTNTNSGNMLFNAGNNNSGPDLFFSNGILSWNTWDSSNNPFGSIPASSSNGNWHNYVVVNDAVSNTTKLYYDGVLYGTAVYRNASVSTSLYIGGTTSTYMWNGAIGNFQVHNRVLTPLEVGQNFNNIKTRYGVL